MTKADLKKLKWLGKQAVENHAVMLANEIATLHENLGNEFNTLPEWSYLMQISGEFEALAKEIAFLKRLK